MSDKFDWECTSCNKHGYRATDNDMAAEHRANRFKEFKGLQGLPFRNAEQAKRLKRLEQLRVRDNRHALANDKKLVKEEIDMGQVPSAQEKIEKAAELKNRGKGELAADGNELTHSVSYDLTNKKVVGYRHIPPAQRTENGPVRERTFELPLEKPKYEKALKAVVKKHGVTARGAKVAHDLFLAYSRAKNNVLKEGLSFGQYLDYIYEALTADHKTKVDAWEKGSNKFSDRLFGGSDKDKNTHQRKYYDFNQSADDSLHIPEINAHLQKHGYQIHDYKAGLATNDKGRQIKIGKVLNNTKADPALIKKYETDPARASSQTKSPYKILISRHPHDVAGMSTGQSWSSCMNIDSGCNKRYLQKDVKKGTHVAYLVHADDTNGEPQKPIARVAIKKHSDGKRHATLHAEKRAYGNAPSSFTKQVQDILDKEHNHHQPVGEYKKTPGVYDDDSSRDQPKFNLPTNKLDDAVGHEEMKVRKAAAEHSALKPEQIDKLQNDPTYTVRRAVASRPDLNASQLDKALSDTETTVRARAVKNPSLTPEHLDKAIADTDSSIKHAAANHPNLTPKHLDSLANDESTDIRQAVASNPKASPEAIDKLAKDENSRVRKNAMSHHNIKPEHLDAELNRPEEHHWDSAKVAALENPKVPVHHLEKALDGHDTSHAVAAVKNPALPAHLLDKAFSHPNAEVRRSALSNPKTDSHHIEKAVQDPEYSVATRALDHDKVTPHHLKVAAAAHGKVDGGYYGGSVKTAILNHPKLNSDVLDTLASDSSSRIRQSVAEHPDTNPETIAKLAGDETQNVSYAAMKHPKLTPAHLEHVMQHGSDIGKYHALQHPNVDPKHLDAAFKGDNHEHMLGALDNPNIKSHHLDAALQHHNTYVRQAAIKHPMATSAHLDKGLADPDQEVRRAAIRHPNAEASHVSKAILDPNSKIAADAMRHPKVTSDHLHQAIKSGDRELRKAVMNHPLASDEHFHALATHPDHYTRYDLAGGHSAIPKHHLETLAKDSDPAVRGKAGEALAAGHYRNT